MNIKRIYCIGGLGADKRVFHYLDLNLPINHVNWINPNFNEPLSEYAKRLCEQIDTKERFALLGVSFGGMVAMEMLPYISPEKVILISSAANNNQLPYYFKLGRIFPLYSYVGILPFWLMKYMFFTKSLLLKQILEETDASYTNWAITRIVNWKTAQSSKKVYRVHGTKDFVIPAKGKVDYIIPNGGHFMVVDQAKQVSNAINQILS